MRIQVRPAKRQGTPRTIFHRALNAGDFKPGHAGAVLVSIDAEGMYADGSKYRYMMEFSPAEVRSVLNAAQAQIIYATELRDSAQCGDGRYRTSAWSILTGRTDRHDAALDAASRYH
ncbi:hypothetical protein [Mesorhizobium sp.]|uniref:hypothetical protein n=1 Tax=Mesorhizobium sp. TaxID=1871066 RepID=UPI00356A9F3B